MLQNKIVNVFYRIVCLIIFIIVIYKVDNFITLSLLTIAFYLFTRNEKNFLLSLWHFITIIVFLISYFTNNYCVLKIALVIDLCYYFLSLPSDDVYEKKTIVMDKYFIRFRNIKRKDVISNNSICTIYVCTHMFVLFIIIMVGSCVI